MAFVRLKNRGDNPDTGLISMRPGRRWAAIPVVGVAIALWSVATMAGLHSVGTSLTAAITITVVWCPLHASRLL
ncbi:hypothetical protein EOA88_30970, partial [Mesorhizobium sp. M5C.F.Ca.IN.020.14.1.1]